MREKSKNVNHNSFIDGIKCNDMRDTWVIILCLFLAIGSLGGAAGFFFGLIQPTIEAQNILKNGAETTATVISLHSNLTQDSERYYYLKLSFINASGEEVTVKTKSLYSEQFISKQRIASRNQFSGKYDVVEKETVQIMYKGDKTVLKGFVPDDDGWWIWLFPVFFGAAGIGLLIAAVCGCVERINDAKIKKNGTDGTGVYLKHSSSSSTNGVNYNNIYFTFKNDQWEYVEVKTGALYEDYEAEALKAMQSFPIKYIGDKAVIVVDKSEFLRFQGERQASV